MNLSTGVLCISGLFPQISQQRFTLDKVTSEFNGVADQNLEIDHFSATKLHKDLDAGDFNLLGSQNLGA